MNMNIVKMGVMKAMDLFMAVIVSTIVVHHGEETIFKGEHLHLGVEAILRPMYFRTIFFAGSRNCGIFLLF